MVKIHNGIAVIHGYVISYYTTTWVESIVFTGGLFPVNVRMKFPLSSRHNEKFTGRM